MRLVIFTLSLALATLLYIQVKFVDKLNALEDAALNLSEHSYVQGCRNSSQKSFEECKNLLPNHGAREIFKNVR